MTTSRAALLGMAALLLAPAAAAGQDPSRFSGSMAVLNTQPLGELSTGPGIGLALAATYAVDPYRIFRIRGEFRASIYDHETRDVCFSTTVGCRILLEMETSYNIVYGGIGPEIVLPLGPVDLAAIGTIGWSAFTATSRLNGVDDEDESFGETNNYEDHTFAWSAGGELRIPVTGQAAITLGGHYQHNGTVSYLREGGITESPDGVLSFDPQTTEANLVAITLGVTVRP